MDAAKISWDDFARVELRVGTVVEVSEFPKARKPAYKLKIFFGEAFGYRQSSAQVCNYAKEELLDKQVICVMNFPEKNIAGFASEVLVLGLDTEGGGIALLTSDLPVANGLKVY